jgi:hypothetical protein
VGGGVGRYTETHVKLRILHELEALPGVIFQTTEISITVVRTADLAQDVEILLQASEES